MTDMWMNLRASSMTDRMVDRSSERPLAEMGGGALCRETEGKKTNKKNKNMEVWASGNIKADKKPDEQRTHGQVDLSRDSVKV